MSALCVLYEAVLDNKDQILYIYNCKYLTLILSCHMVHLGTLPKTSKATKFRLKPEKLSLYSLRVQTTAIRSDFVRHT